MHKRSLWAYHTTWERRLKRIIELAPSVSNKAAQIADTYRGRRKSPKTISQGVWYDDTLIKKSAKPEEVREVAEQTGQLLFTLPTIQIISRSRY